MEQIKLSWKTKFGYGLCTCADSVPYNLFYIYFIYFLTDIVGVQPVLAGLISFIALAWDALTDPVVGGMSDNYVTEKGRRLPWMKRSVLPLAVVVYLMFAPFEIESVAAQSIYYIIVAMLVWLFYTTFLVPYFAMGAELTADYDERNLLRFMTMFIAYPILLLVSSGPMWIWAWAENAGYSDRAAWGYTGTVFALLLLLLCCSGMFLIRDCEKNVIKAALEAQKNRVKQNFYKIWKDCLSIKCFRRIVVWILIYMLGFSMLNTVLVYIMTYNAGMDHVQQAVFWTVYVVIVVCTLPITTFFCNKFGKKPTMLVVMTPAIVSSLIFFFVGINSVPAMYVFATLSVIGSSAFFTFYVGYAYDCIEIDEFLTGERKEGSMTALSTFAQKFGSALALYFTGWVLGFTGYDGMADVQTAEALKGVLSLGTLFPAILSLIALGILATYPVSKQKFALLCAALEKKKAGEEYSTDGFADIL